MRRSSIAIDADLPFEPASPRSGKLDLAETYAVCRHLFGERGKGFDDWKGGFAFPFALEVPVAARPAYLLNVINFRSGVQYNLKLVDPATNGCKTRFITPRTPPSFPARKFIGSWLFSPGSGGLFRSALCLVEGSFSGGAIDTDLVRRGGEEFFTRGFESSEEFEKTLATLADAFPPGFYARDWDW